MLTGIHVLLTYSCNYQCDHCFLFCSPFSEGTFSSEQLGEVLNEARRIGTIEWIYFEGGEPFLYYPVLLYGLESARKMGFKTGIVSNGYWALTERDARLWLKPIAEIGIDDVSVSDDAFHSGSESDRPAVNALAAAESLGLPTCSISIDPPKIDPLSSCENPGAPVTGGNTRLRGRAADKLTEGLPVRPVSELNTCPYENLRDPARVHVDAHGEVQICQGISMGNMWRQPLSEIIRNYDPESHPICGPLADGGPAKLAELSKTLEKKEFADECHLCFELRRSLLDDYPDVLAPRQVYGGEETRQ